ncbi:MAG: SMC-Scp complex subunit ScpB [Kiritimatiellae bacterium]|nr:SMC-Scp complex subunit ScpB [Kiritimatiellia bacterium]
MSEQVKIPLPRSLQEIVGALLFASQDPLSASELRDAVRAVEPEEGENAEVMDVYKTCTSREIDEAIKGLGKALEVAGCGFRLVCTGGTYRLQTVPSCGRYVRAMLKLDRPSRLGRASLETLAIIAYRQPITKSEIEDIRGVDVTANIKTLMDLQLIRLVGRSELPGHPFLYGTTQIFLDHFGISSLQQLNELDPTLQRSNPRLKAEQYKRVEKKTELEKAAEEAAKDEGVVEGEGEGKGEGEGDGKGEGVGEGIVEGAGEGEAVDKGAPAEDDDFFIDDTPDEFDDDDDEDEDEEDIDEEDENEDDDE